MSQRKRYTALRPRCVWSDRRGQCTAYGSGDPPLCRRHYEWLYHGRETETRFVGEEEERNIADEVLTEILEHPSVRQFGNSVDQRVQGLFDGILDRFDRGVDRILNREVPPHERPEYQGPGRAYEARWPPRQPQRQEPPRQQKRQRQRRQAPPQRPSTSVDDALILLGFAPGSKPTAADIKARRRELARIYHSDAGGSDESMRRVNAAVDVLLRSKR